MSRYDDENDEFEGSEDTDAVIRELRTEVVRLEAELDQVRASLRERAAELAIIRADIAELEVRIARIEARRKRDLRLIVIAWAMMLVSLALSVFTYLTT